MRTRTKMWIAICVPVIGLALGGWTASKFSSHSNPRADARLAFILSTPGLTIRDPNRPELYQTATTKGRKSDRLPLAALPFSSVDIAVRGNEIVQVNPSTGEPEEEEEFHAVEERERAAMK